MSNTEVRGSQETGVRSQKTRARRRAFFCLLTPVFCLLFAGCRQDMQDQPRYEYYEPGDKKFFADGASSRLLVEGTVPRASGEYRDREDYFYTGKDASGVAWVPGRGNAAGSQAGGGGAAV